MKSFLIFCFICLSLQQIYPEGISQACSELACTKQIYYTIPINTKVKLQIPPEPLLNPSEQSLNLMIQADPIVNGFATKDCWTFYLSEPNIKVSSRAETSTTSNPHWTFSYPGRQGTQYTTFSINNKAVGLVCSVEVSPPSQPAQPKIEIFDVNGKLLQDSTTYQGYTLNTISEEDNLLSYKLISNDKKTFQFVQGVNDKNENDLTSAAFFRPPAGKGQNLMTHSLLDYVRGVKYFRYDWNSLLIANGWSTKLDASGGIPADLNENYVYDASKNKLTGKISKSDYSTILSLTYILDLSQRKLAKNAVCTRVGKNEAKCEKVESNCYCLSSLQSQSCESIPIQDNEQFVSVCCGKDCYNFSLEDFEIDDISKKFPTHSVWLWLPILFFCVGFMMLCIFMTSPLWCHRFPKLLKKYVMVHNQRTTTAPSQPLSSMNPRKRSITKRELKLRHNIQRRSSRKMKDGNFFSFYNILII